MIDVEATLFSREKAALTDFMQQKQVHLDLQPWKQERQEQTSLHSLPAVAQPSSTTASMGYRKCKTAM